MVSGIYICRGHCLNKEVEWKSQLNPDAVTKRVRKEGGSWSLKAGQCIRPIMEILANWQTWRNIGNYLCILWQHLHTFGKVISNFVGVK